MKQIYASLELAEDEVRILVGEYYNTRFNIIKLATAPCEGISNFRIVDRQKVIEAINECVADVENKVGAKLEKVILLIPSENYKRIPLKVNVVPGVDGLKKEDVVRALNKTLEVHVDPDLMVINRLPIKYTVNGISTHKLPEKEICNEVVVDIDLLCADKMIAYDYVGVVEECGLSVLDICLNTYAVCKEAVLIEQSFNKNVVLLDINNTYTNMSLISKGKLLSAKTIQSGLEKFVQALYNEIPLPYGTLLRLIKYNGSKETEENDIIFAYTKNEKTINVTSEQLNSTIRIPVDKYIKDIVDISMPIVNSGETMFVIVGEGADMKMIADMLNERTQCDIKIYHPDTLGVRESNLIALFGSFFVMKETANLRDEKIVCVDLLEFDNVVNHKKEDVEGQTLTTRIKTLFKNITKENEDE